MAKRNLTGVLLLDKPIGLSSNQALQKIKYLFQAQKAGHTGSLDPLATGLLPICFGEATKFSQCLLEADKFYLVKMKLGIRTTTSDAEGEVIAEKPVPALSKETIEKALNQFRGDSLQVPSMYSALKYQGKPLYQYAREGISIDRPARAIHIFQLNCLEQGNDFLVLSIHCTKGTYVRTIVDDLGELFGCGAHVIALRRTAVGQYTNDSMYTLEALEAMTAEQRDTCLIDVSTMLAGIFEVSLSKEMSRYMMQGQPVFVSGAPTSGLVKLLDSEKQFLGVGEIAEDGKVAPKRLVKNVYCARSQI